MNDLTHIDLFSGIGGFSLAAGWAGFRTVCFCEIEPFCQEVLKTRFNAVIADPTGKRLGGRCEDGSRQQSGVLGQDIPTDGAEARFRAVADSANNGCHRHDSSREVESGESSDRKQSGGGWSSGVEGCNSKPILIGDIRTFDGTRFRGATLLTGGFPCQPFSHAGKRRGKADDRHLWPEMRRVIAEAHPHWVLAENVSGIIGMELDQVLADLEMEGYAARTFHIGAVGINAPHRRMRVWIVAHDDGGRLQVGSERDGQSEQPELETSRRDNAHRRDSDAPDTTGRETQSAESGGFYPEPGGQDWGIPWVEVATRLCRVDDGLPTWVNAHRVARLKALGNSIVPQVAYQIIKAIAEIERGMNP